MDARRCATTVTCALTLLCAPLGTAASDAAQRDDDHVHALWFARGRAAFRLPVDVGHVDLEIDAPAMIQCMAIDVRRGRVWLYAGGQLLAYDLGGQRLVKNRVMLTGRRVRPAPPQRLHGMWLAVRPDHGLWLIRDHSLVLLGPAGEVQGRRRLSARAVDTTVDLRHALLWVASRVGLSAYDRSGRRVRHLVRPAGAVSAVDAEAGSGRLWLAGPTGLRLVDGTGTPLRRYPSVRARSLASVSTGGLWAFGRKAVWRIDASGQVAATRRLPPMRHSGLTRSATVDPADGTAWFLAGGLLRHLGRDAGVLSQVPLEVGATPPTHSLSGLVVYADVFRPELRIDSPTDGAFLSTHRPTLGLSYHDNGVGVDPATLRARSSGHSLPLECSADTAAAACTPAHAIPDGAVDVDVTVADFAGNRSTAARVTFAVDTIRPRITLESPADGSYVNDAHPVLSGSISEPATVTLDGTPLALDIHRVFARRLDLKEGANTLHLGAIDRAGNRGAEDVHVTLDTIPPAPVSGSAVTIDNPHHGRVTISGGQGSVPAGMAVVLTNVESGSQMQTTAAADGSFSATIDAKAGQTLEMRTKDRAGNLSDPLRKQAGPPLPPDPRTVASRVEPTVSTSVAEATAFLYRGSDPIQTGAAAGAVEPRRAAVIRGRVVDRAGTPLSGVAITVRGHPELGQSLTRADGRYDLAVNGGGTLVLHYARSGYLGAWRRLSLNWESYLEAPTVALVEPDAHATPVSFRDTSVAQIVAGGMESDAAGTRRAIAVFAPGTQASMRLPDGSIQSLTAGDVRITEYTVGGSGREAMPARLPDMSAYTYAVDLAIDQARVAGATRVDFDTPVRVYVRNFLGFPVGGAVPAGWYEPSSARWVPADNGRIIGVLSLDPSGCGVLDVDGSGQPASATALQALGIDQAEGCRIGHLYAPGQSFWRVSVRHFTIWDFNWPPPLHAPPGAVAPTAAPALGSAHQPDSSQSDRCPGCLIDVHSQVLGETIPIAGTSYRLVYSSDRTGGYTPDRTIDIPVSGDPVPDHLLGVNVSVEVAGQTIHRHFPPDPDQHFRFLWNGRDAYGRKVYGYHEARVEIAYVYPGVYQTPAPESRSFDAAPGQVQQVGPSFVMAGRTLSLSRTWTRRLQANTPDSGALGGWQLSVHNQYEPGGHVLLRGDGTHRSAESVSAQVRTVVGGGAKAPDNLPATQAALSQPSDIATDAAGNMFIASYGQGVLEVTPDGLIHRPSPNVTHPSTVAVGPDGDLYVGSYADHFIYRMVPDGSARVVAGNGKPCPYATSECGDGGPALDAELGIQDLAVGHDGTLYVMHEDSWSGNERLKEITPDGILHNLVTWTGQLACCRAGEVSTSRGGGIYYGGWEGPVLRLGGAAGAAAIRSASSIIHDFAQGPGGSVYVFDGNRIWRVAPDGRQSLAAGTGKTCLYYQHQCGDGGLARDAAFNGGGIGGLAVGPDGTIYVADRYTNRIRAIAPSLPGRQASEIVVPSEDGGSLFYFTAAGRLLRTTRATTGTLLYRFGYDDAGRLIRLTDGDGNVTTIERNGNGRATAIVAPGGEETTLRMNALGRLVQVTDPGGASWNMAYSASGLLTSRRDRDGNVDQYMYDAAGRLVKVEEPTGTRWMLQRKPLGGDGYSVSITGGDGLTQGFSVMPLGNDGRKLVHSFPDGTQQTRIYGGDGSVETHEPDGTVRVVKQGADPRFGPVLPIPASTVVRTPSGLRRTRTIERAITRRDSRSLALGTQTDTITVNGDSYRRVLDVSDHTLMETTPTGRIISGVLGDQGRLSRLQVGDLAAVRYGRDSHGRLVSVVRGSGSDARTVSLTYGPKGSLASVTDPSGRTEHFERDALGRVTKETRPDGSEVFFRYDAEGNVTAVVPPGRPAHDLTYDSHDDLASYSPPGIDGSRDATLYHYDASHRLASVDYPGGASLTLTYGSRGHLVSTSAPWVTRGYQYDQITGQLTEVDAGVETLALAWDGSLPTVRRWGGTVSGSVAYTYDDYFRITQVTVAEHDVARGYDKDGLLTKAGRLTLTRDASDGLVVATALGEMAGTRRYDQFGALIEMTANYQEAALYSAQYQRDSLGRIVSKTETVGGVTSTYDYAYDRNGRVLQVRGDGMVTDTYTYDDNGNRVSHNGTKATYDDRDRLVTYGSTSYRYNARGQLSEKTDSAGITHRDYDVLGNLREVKLPDGRTIDYIIDGRDRRVGEKIDGKLVHGFLYKDQLNPVAELDGSGNVVARFVYGAKPNVPAYMIKKGQTYRIVSDSLGSVRLVVNVVTGEVVQRMDYSPFGRVVKDTNPGFQPFGFAGGIYDPDTGLVRFGARDYDAETGSWMTSDPTLFQGKDANLYGYAFSDPINLIDPMGSWSFSLGAYAGLGGAILIGQDPRSGQWFYGGRLGIGLGGGASFDYQGRRPGGSERASCNHGTTYGDFIAASGNVGPYQWNPVDAHAGYDTATHRGYHEGPLSTKLAFGNGAGIGIGGAVGVEIIGH